jgi:hypothetical protein
MLPSGDDAQIAADLVSHACLRVQWSPPSADLHAGGGIAMRAATLEVLLEELGFLRLFCRPRVSNDKP